MRIILGLLISLLWSLQSYSAQIIMEVGSTETISSPGSGAIRVKNGKLVSVEDLGHRIKITAKKSGYVTITTLKNVTEIFILTHTEYEFYKSALTELKEMRGLSLTVSEDGISLTGELLRASDLETLSQIPNAKFNFSAKIDSTVQDGVRSLIEKSLSLAKLSHPVIRFEPSLAVLIAKEQSLLKDQYSRALLSLGVPVEQTTTVVELQPLVRVKIAVTEIKKKFVQKFGVQWPHSAHAQLLPTFVAPSDGQGVSVQLDALEENGLGKILASPTLLCRSGKSAEFFAGGEFPIRVIGRKNSEVIWKKHGIILKISPVADRSGRMSIGLTTEVSTLDMSQEVDGVPGLLTNRIESHFDLSRSRTIALSGLLKEEKGESRTGLPGLSSIPILGHLFSSQDYRDHKTELVVFVTPEVVSETRAEDGSL